MHRCAFVGKAKESQTHIVGECEMCKEERGALEEETRKIDECDTWHAEMHYSR